MVLFYLEPQGQLQQMPLLGLSHRQTQLLKAPLHQWLLELLPWSKKILCNYRCFNKGTLSYSAKLPWNTSTGGFSFEYCLKLFVVRSFFLPVQPSSVTEEEVKGFITNQEEAVVCCPWSCQVTCSAASVLHTCVLTCSSYHSIHHLPKLSACFCQYNIALNIFKHINTIL